MDSETLDPNSATRERSGISDDEQYEEILNKLGLQEYYPQKLSLIQVLQNVSDKLIEMHDVPWHFISNILVQDFTRRDDILPRKNSEEIQVKSNTNANSGKLRERLAKLRKVSNTDTFSLEIHPIDLLIIVFHCSSNFLRQVLSEKMFLCKLSIPLVLPQFMDRKPEYLPWSLRSIMLQSKQTNGEYYECSAVSTPTAIVSCLRLGKLHRSKSKFLNELLNGQTHNTFFHRDCLNGMTNRVLTEGFMEIAWYIPSSEVSTDSQFSENIAFVNIRGDGKLNSSIRFLLEISNVFLIMAEVTELLEPYAVALRKSIRSAGKELILMISNGQNTLSDQDFDEYINKFFEEIEEENFSDDNIILDCSSDGERNIQELKTEVIVGINRSLPNKARRSRLEDLKEMAVSLNLSVDENNPDCKKSQERASEIVENLEKISLKKAKDNFLPLQCKPWKEWANLNRELNRLERVEGDVLQYGANLSVQKKEMRKQQIQLLKKPSNLFLLFLDYLLATQDDERLYFLTWLKLYLDNISKNTIPGLQREYCSTWSKLKKCESKEEALKLEKGLQTLENDITGASFGLEHLMREIGQAYEAVTETSESNLVGIKTKIKGLPEVMAKLMIDGYPLEIMDGDASHVAQLWVKAVLKELEKRLQNKRLLVLTVLGIQSSGKSTMLNTMFGLQFAVAAGRCTRGAYAQLVPMSKKQERPFDYILVIDTEGLRALDFSRSKLQYDNELATLVTGLGDVTLVNLKGENYSEMEDVLQIVIHAFVKMKMVNQNMALQPSCVFVHQNVGAVDASQKLKTGQQIFVDTLDMVTTAAAMQEGARNYTKFKQVIDFDLEGNVWYISDLWKGDPPMAPVNPGYSQKIVSVKQKLLTDTMEKRTSFTTVSDLILKLGNLWEAVLKENFVFSFKNSLEINSYNSLEKKFSELSWALKNSALEWVQGKKSIISDHEGDAKKLKTYLKKECKSHLDSQYTSKVEDLEQYFVSSKVKEILEQWRGTTFINLQTTYLKILSSSEKALENELKKRDIRLEKEKFKRKYEEEIRMKARALAEELTDTPNLDDSELKKSFNQMWYSLMESLSEGLGEGDANIHESVMKIMLNKMSKYKSILVTAIEKYVMDPKKSIMKKMDNIMRNHSFPCNNKLIQELLKGIKTDLSHYGVSEASAEAFIARVKSMKYSGIAIKSEGKFVLSMSVYACQYATYKYMENITDGKTARTKSTLQETEVHSVYKKFLFRKFPELYGFVAKELERCQIPLPREFQYNPRDCIESERSWNPIRFIFDDRVKQAKEIIDGQLKYVKFLIETIEYQAFEVEQVEKLIDNLMNNIAESEKNQKFSFKPQFKTEIVLYLCILAIPKCFEMHKVYMEDLDMRNVYEKEYDRYFGVFKDHYLKVKAEEKFANELSVIVIKAIEEKVDEDLPRLLTSDVRLNVSEVNSKASLLKAVLLKLLEEDTFEEFDLFLTNIDECLDKWLTYFINEYIFNCADNERTRYVTLASQKIDSTLFAVCNVIDRIRTDTLMENVDENAKVWLAKLKEKVSSEVGLSIDENLSSLKNKYDIEDLTKFKSYLQEILKRANETLYDTFRNHTINHLRKPAENMYTLIGEYCKGCTESCPFCKAPCSLSTENHHLPQCLDCKRDKRLFDDDCSHCKKLQLETKLIKHSAVEHFPQACGGCFWINNEKLVIENCTVSVASDTMHFRYYEDNIPKWHPYKTYYELGKPHSDWQIVGDISLEASPYWKWFLVKYGDTLANKYDVESPILIEEWKQITKDDAKKSLE